MRFTCCATLSPSPDSVVIGEDVSFDLSSPALVAAPAPVAAAASRASAALRLSRGDLERDRDLVPIGE